MQGRMLRKELNFYKFNLIWLYFIILFAWSVLSVSLEPKSEHTVDSYTHFGSMKQCEQQIIVGISKHIP